MTNNPEVDKRVEIETSVYILKEKLRRFGEIDDVHERADAIPDLIAQIREHANQDTLKLLVNEEFQSHLQEAVEKALKTPFLVKGAEVVPWSGGFTIVALDLDGEIHGAVSKPTEGLEAYGDLYPYAVTKAVLAAHLWQSSKQSPLNKLGIGDLDNFEDLSRVTKTRIYNGATVSPAYSDLWPKGVYIGGSGCAVKEDYLKELLGGATPAPDTQAGRFDAIFCELVGNYLEGEEIRPMQEPRDVREIRINN